MMELKLTPRRLNLPTLQLTIFTARWDHMVIGSMSRVTGGAGNRRWCRSILTGGLIATGGVGFIQIAAGIGCRIIPGVGRRFITGAGSGTHNWAGAGHPIRSGDLRG